MVMPKDAWEACGEEGRELLMDGWRVRGPQACQVKTREDQTVRQMKASHRAQPQCQDPPFLGLPELAALASGPCLCWDADPLGPQCSRVEPAQRGGPRKPQLVTSDFWPPAAGLVDPSVLERKIFYLCFEVNKVESDEAWRVGVSMELFNIDVRGGKWTRKCSRPFSESFHIMISFHSYNSFA